MSNLYHYCSTRSFLALIQNRSLWLSSLSLSNDSMEGKILRSTVQKIIHKQGLTEEQSAELFRAINEVEELIDGLGFCLSEQGDLLSQWRGYADDGRGFSVGFSESYLRDFSESSGSSDSKVFMEKVYVEKVIYEEAQQIEIVEGIFHDAIDNIKAGNLKEPSLPGLLFRDSQEAQEKYREARRKHSAALADLNLRALSSFNHLYTLKNPAFAEEQEWRLISYLIKLWKNSLGSGIKDNCFHRATPDRLIPYREYVLKDISQPVINEVILGPKNTTPIDVVEHLLLQNDFGGVKEVRRSAATYR